MALFSLVASPTPPLLHSRSALRPPLVLPPEVGLFAKLNLRIPPNYYFVRGGGSTAAALNRRGGGVGGERENSSLPSSDISTFGASISTDLPLYEPPWASFDDYLDDRNRIFQAMFPDKRRSQRLNDEEWRIKMLPIKFLLLSVNPVVDMRVRCTSEGERYPSGVPPYVAKVLELQATRWELQGLDRAHMPSHFELNVQGMLYSDRRGKQTRLKGQLGMSISFVLPPVLALVPEDVLRGIAETVLKKLVERMKEEVDVSLLSDFRDFSREKRRKQEKGAALLRPPTDPSAVTGSEPSD